MLRLYVHCLSCSYLCLFNVSFRFIFLLSFLSLCLSSLFFSDFLFNVSFIFFRFSPLSTSCSFLSYILFFPLPYSLLSSPIFSSFLSYILFFPLPYSLLSSPIFSSFFFPLMRSGNYVYLSETYISNRTYGSQKRSMFLNHFEPKGTFNTRYITHWRIVITYIHSKW